MKQPQKLIELEPEGKIIFVGDTHGDLEASQKIIKKYRKPNCRIVFLGDYVDRGKKSKENINYLLNLKKKYPAQIFLLLGNHEAYNVQRCYPAEFWESLSDEEKKKYGEIFKEFPLVVSVNGILALHGVPPELKKIEDINGINEKDKNWHTIMWGDFIDQSGYKLGNHFMTGRPEFGKDYFQAVMKNFKKEVLIRSHQPYRPEIMFNRKCLTIFTSSAYPRKRVIAVADFTKKPRIESTDDLIIEEI